MPPRSVCLNVFTSSLGDGNGAVNNGRHSIMDRRDSAQSGMFGFFEVAIVQLEIGIAMHSNMAIRHSETVL